MTFELGLAQPESDTVPVPVSPTAQRGARTSRRIQLFFLAAVWVAFAALFVGVSVSLLLGADWMGFDAPGPLMPSMAYLFVPVVAITWHQFSGESARKIYGYAHTAAYPGRNVSRSPDHSRPASRVASSIGWIIGWVVALIGVWVADDVDAEAWRWVLAALVSAVTLGPAVLALVEAVPRLSAGRRWLEDARARRDAVIELAAPHRAVVTSAEPVSVWVDSLPLLTVTLEWTDAVGERHATIRFTDHPCWAPVPGTRFDVWTDPDAPFDPARTFVRRSLLDQPFHDDPMSLRAPDEGDSGRGPVRPGWIGEDGLTPASGGGRWVFAAVASLGGVIGLLGFALALGAYDLSALQVAAVAAHALFLVLAAALWVTVCLRWAWLADHAYQVAFVLVLPFVTLFPVALGVLSSDAAQDVGAAPPTWS